MSFRRSWLWMRWTKGPETLQSSTKPVYSDNEYLRTTAPRCIIVYNPYSEWLRQCTLSVFQWITKHIIHICQFFKKISREKHKQVFSNNFLLYTGLIGGSFLFSPIAIQQCTCMGEVSHKSNQHSSFWVGYFNTRKVRMIKPTKRGQEYAKRAIQAAAFQISTFPMRSLIKLQAADLQSPYPPGEKRYLQALSRPHRRTHEGNSSLVEMKPHVEENDSRKAHPGATALACSFATHIINRHRSQPLKWGAIWRWISFHLTLT